MYPVSRYPYDLHSPKQLCATNHSESIEPLDIDQRFFSHICVCNNWAVVSNMPRLTANLDFRKNFIPDDYGLRLQKLSGVPKLSTVCNNWAVVNHAKASHWPRNLDFRKKIIMA